MRFHYASSAIIERAVTTADDEWRRFTGATGSYDHSHPSHAAWLAATIRLGP